MNSESQTPQTRVGAVHPWWPRHRIQGPARCLLTVCGLLLCLACDDGTQDDRVGIGEPCDRSSQCLWAAVCRGGLCVDGADTGRSAPPPVAAPRPDAEPFDPQPPEANEQDQGVGPPPPDLGVNDWVDMQTPDVSPPPEVEPPDAAPPPPTIRCDEATGRAEGVEGALTCDAEPQFLTVDGRFQVFRYEASHPLADSGSAFPCASRSGRVFEAPVTPTEACSTPGVRPWHSVRWTDAHQACAAIGWRLCSGEELARACGGPQGFDYTWGSDFQAGACNLRESWSEAGRAGPAPTGTLPECLSPEGAFDLTGNLWEWVAGGDDASRTAQGAGWRTIAERHRERDLVCTASSRVAGVTASSYANPDFGFRCCRSL